jgi:peptide/nickel transport system permease protein
MPWTSRVGATIILIYVLVAAFAPWIAPYGQSEIVGKAFLPGDSTFLLGTDQLGRDLLSRLIYGIRTSITIAAAATAISFAIGVPLGIFSAMRPGWIANLLGAGVDLVVSVPTLVFALMFLALTGRGNVNLVVIIGVLDSASVFLVSRAIATNIASMDYVEVARLRGERLIWLIVREILPNMRQLLSAEFGLRFGFTFLTISALSFLGVGIQPPTADLGSMIADTKSMLIFGRPTPFYPALCILLLSLAVNILIDGVQRASLSQ